jgi:hypothetical protein
MREPANKRMLTDVSGFRSYRCTISECQTLSSFRERMRQVDPNLDKGWHFGLLSLSKIISQCRRPLSVV